MKEPCDRQYCVGCGACFSACNNSAISMQPDSLGFLYPVIDPNKCVDCGLCVKSCFNNNKLNFVEPAIAYVGCAADLEEQISSTSGGLASIFMREVIQSGGIVYGCSGENARDVKHIRINNLSDIERLKGSKYVQSNMGSTYRSILFDLKQDKTVLFIGTPCQVAGLNAYLKDIRHGNLLTVDFVCHGVPSQKILNDEIDLKCKGQNDLRLINRVKDYGKESKYTLRIVNKNGIVLNQNYPSMGYVTGFLCGLFYRENCYSCQFTRKDRVSDVTLGDFWDRNNDVTSINNKECGLSMIMVNTDKGKDLINKCNPAINIVQWKYDDFIRRNGQLTQPVERHKERDLFEKLYREKGYKIALKKTLKEDLIRIKRYFFIRKISVFLFHIPYIKKIYSKLNK